MTTDLPIADLYVQMVASCVSLFKSVDSDDWAKTVPCTPDWSVRDVLSHVSGLADDVTNGRVEGAATDPWTAAQVDRYRNDDPTMLLDRWQNQAPDVGRLLESIGEARPVFDCHTHEHDVRHAIDRPGNRDLEVVAISAGRLATIVIEAAPATIKLDDGRSFGQGSAVVDGLSSFEVFRSCLGRRSREQVAAYNWAGPQTDIDAAIDSWFNFGPSDLPIEE